MQSIDARNLACPQPVILAKKGLDAQGQIEILVDNKVAVENLRKLAQNLGAAFSPIAKQDHYQIHIAREGEAREALVEQQTEGKRCLVLSSREFGWGEQELGEILMKGMLFSLTESARKPSLVILINSGVQLIQDVAARESLELLKEQGVQILACGTCLDYYHLTDQFDLGEVTNMYHIVEILSSYQVQIL